MKILKNKFWVKLIISICLVLTVFTFTANNKAYAEGEKVWGDVLLEPITALLVAIGDGAMDLLHKAIQDQDLTLITIKSETTWTTVWKIIAVVALALVIIATGVALGAMACGAFAGLAAKCVAGGFWATTFASIGTTTAKAIIIAGAATGTVVAYKVRQRLDRRPYIFAGVFYECRGDIC